MAVLRNNTMKLQDDKEMAPALFLPRPFLYAYLCLGLFICVLCIVTICTLWKCRKLAAKIRLLSINLTVANLIYGLTLLSNFAHYKATGFICRSFLKFLPLTLLLHKLFLTAAGVDRLLSLQRPLTYSMWRTKRNIYCSILIIYVIGIAFSKPNVISNFSCHASIFTYGGLFSFMSGLIFLITCDVFIYGYVAIVAVRAKFSHQAIGKRNDYRQYWLVTMRCFYLSVASLACFGPFIVSRAMDLWHHRQSDDFSQSSAVAYLFYLLHQVVSPVFILCSYKECRYRIALLFCLCCPNKRQAIEESYKQYYATFVISSQIRMMESGL